MSQVGPHHRRRVPLVPLVVRLVLEKDELVALIIRAVVPQVRHANKIIIIQIESRHLLNSPASSALIQLQLNLSKPSLLMR